MTSSKTRKARPCTAVDFSSLPPDVLRLILGSLLPRQSVARLACCSRAWREASKDMLTALHLFRMGKRHKGGRKGVKKCAQLALQCFLGAAEKGLPAAMVDAGLILWDQGDSQQALLWFREAARQGHTTAMTNLALALQQQARSDTMSLPAETEALRWLLQASRSSCGKAQYSLALALHHGGPDLLATRAALEAVTEGLTRAADLQGPPSLAQPESVFQEQAAHQRMRAVASWYKQAAEAGVPRAMYNLSKCLADGVGVAQDAELGMSWLRRAASAGHTAASADCKALEEGQEEARAITLVLATTAHHVAARPVAVQESAGVRGDSQRRASLGSAVHEQDSDSNPPAAESPPALTASRLLFRELRRKRGAQIAAPLKTSRHEKSGRNMSARA